MRLRVLLLIAAAGLSSATTLTTGCHSKDNIPVAPAPLRPEPEPDRDLANRNTRVDCDPVDPTLELPALKYDERQPDEAQDRAEQAVAMLREAETGEMPQSRREGLIRDAVFNFIGALQADPYNVRASYNLAAAYARIGRKQCSLNLLSRIIQMRKHGSRKVEVEKSLDRLLGRGNATLDPDFNDMRGDDRFRSMIRNMCAGTNDPTCVHGR